MQIMKYNIMHLINSTNKIQLFLYLFNFNINKVILAEKIRKRINQYNIAINLKKSRRKNKALKPIIQRLIETVSINSVNSNK